MAIGRKRKDEREKLMVRKVGLPPP